MPHRACSCPFGRVEFNGLPEVGGWRNLMAIQQVRQHVLSLVPVQDQASNESGLMEAVGPASERLATLDLPESQTRISPRAMADQVVHQPVANAHRLTRASFLTGDWGLVDVSR